MDSLWFQSALLPQGWAKNVRVRVEGGKIASVEQGVTARAAESAGALALPGMCNVHSHAFQRGMAGLTERRGANAGDDFWSWRELMYRFLDRLTPEHIEAISALAFAEMLEGGFTRVGEFHYLHHDPAGQPYAEREILARAVVNAAECAGIGMTLLPVFYAHSDFGGKAPNHGQRRFINDVGGFADLLQKSANLLSGDASLGVAIHSLRAATASEIAEILALDLPGPIHMHAAEQVKEVDACVAHSGARPVEWLLANTPLDACWCLVHATHMTDAETRGLAARGAVAGLCPITEANLGDGVFQAPLYLQSGGAFGLGTDSNILVDVAEELRTMEYSQRLARRARCVLSDEKTPSVGRNLFERAVKGGAQALGVAGGIAPGAVADIVTLKMDHLSLADREGDQALDAWIFAARGGAIDSVWRGGVKVVEAGRHRAKDAISARYRAAVREILAA